MLTKLLIFQTTVLQVSVIMRVYLQAYDKVNCGIHLTDYNFQHIFKFGYIFTFFVWRCLTVAICLSLLSSWAYVMPCPTYGSLVYSVRLSGDI